ncbi:Uma2 family endonuclease [Granulicella arctica]|uniref:Uma2 family endonuclease n=2 Tax=Granulicella arctica TaxID=940613 RepID=A0A7Y9PGR3_9BACT|nr:Uma2 family endonuclease [Granulicella arctica]
MTPARSRASKINMRIGRLLDRWAEADGCGVVFDSNGGFTLPDGSMRAADAAWMRLEKWESLSAEGQARYAPLCLDFVIELRSQSVSSPISKPR